MSLSKDKLCYAQNFSIEEQHHIDSLNKIISNAKSHDTSLAGAYISLSEILYVSNIDTLKPLCEKAIIIAEKALEGKPNKTIKNNLLASLSAALNNIGYIYMQQGDVPNALGNFHKSLEMDEELGDKSGVAMGLNNIGFIYSNQGDTSKAKEYYHKSLKIREEIGDKYGVAQSLNNLGVICDLQGDLLKALEYYNKSLEINKQINDQKEVASSLNNIAAIYNNLGDYQESLVYGKKSLEIYQEIGNKEGIGTCYNNLAICYDNQADLSKALIYGQKSLKIAQEINYPVSIKNAANILSKVYQKKGNYKEALAMRNLEIQMRDSIYNEATQKATAQQQAKYEYEKQKTIDDAAHDKQIALEQEEQKKQRIISISIGVGLLLVVIFLFFVFNRLRVTRKQKIVIEQQRDIVEEAHKEIKDSINYAERIQRSFLATEDLLDENLNEYFVFFQPKDVVSGDFYWAGKLANNQFAMVNADSTGHGVPGAIMSILNISSIEKAVEKGITNPAEIFNDTRKTIIERLKKDGSTDGGKDGMDASIISFDKITNKFSYTAAQNPIWIIRNKELLEIKPEKMPIGKHDNDSIPFIGGEFKTEEGDVIYTLTDGFQDQFGGEKGKKFKLKPFKDFLIGIANLPMKEQQEKLQETFTKWKGNEEQVDDVCVIGVRI